MSKITIIGLGLVGNSIGMGLRRAAAEAGSRVSGITVAGFDPSREREGDALRKYGSVDEIAHSLESAARDAEMVIVATPMSAAREVFSALAPLVAEDTVITDVLPAKGLVMAWAGELLEEHGGFVGGHPLSLNIDLDTATGEDLPDPNLFRGAPYCIVTTRHTSSEALNSVIGLAEALGATPLFIDAQEHDSFMAAAQHLPALVGAALWRVVGRSPAWSDIQQFAHGNFAGATEALAADSETLTGALLANRRELLGWLDRLLVDLQGARDKLASGDRQALLNDLSESGEEYAAWTEHTSVSPEVREARERAETRNAIDDARPSRSFLGTYISDRVFRRKRED